MRYAMCDESPVRRHASCHPGPCPNDFSLWTLFEVCKVDAESYEEEKVHLWSVGMRMIVIMVVVVDVELASTKSTMSATVLATGGHELFRSTYDGDILAWLQVFKSRCRRLHRSPKLCLWCCHLDTGNAAIVGSIHNAFDACEDCYRLAMRCCRTLVLPLDVCVLRFWCRRRCELKAPSHGGSAQVRLAVNPFEDVWATYYESCDGCQRLSSVVLGARGRGPMRRHPRHHYHQLQRGGGVLGTSSKVARRMP